MIERAIIRARKKEIEMASKISKELIMTADLRGTMSSEHNKEDEDNHKDAEIIKVKSEVHFTEKFNKMKKNAERNVKIPSERQIDYVLLLASDQHREVPKEVLESESEAYQFIDKYSIIPRQRH